MYLQTTDGVDIWWEQEGGSSSRIIDGMGHIPRLGDWSVSAEEMVGVIG